MPLLLASKQCQQYLIEYPEVEDSLQKSLNAEYLRARNNVVSNLMKWRKNGMAALQLCDVPLSFASILLASFQARANEYGPESAEFRVNDFSITIINVCHFFETISLNTMQRAYGSESQEALWQTSGVYLRRSFGLLEFYRNELPKLPVKVTDEHYNLMVDLASELKLIQQLGVVVLSLSKLRSKMYSSSRDAVLDLSNENIQDLSKNCLFFAKLVIGCRDYAVTLPNSSIVNKSLILYLDALAFVLVSLDRYQKDQPGVALGMVNAAVEIMSKFVSTLRLNNSVLSNMSKKDQFKSFFQLSKTAASKHLKKSALISDLNVHSSGLHPLLDQTLDEFFIPLTSLVRYRYQQTNDTLTFEAVEKDVTKLRSMFPNGKTPELSPLGWTFDGIHLQNLDSDKMSKTSSSPVISSNDHYF